MCQLTVFYHPNCHGTAAALHHHHHHPSITIDSSNCKLQCNQHYNPDLYMQLSRRAISVFPSPLLVHLQHEKSFNENGVTPSVILCTINSGLQLCHLVHHTNFKYFCAISNLASACSRHFASHWTIFDMQLQVLSFIYHRVESISPHSVQCTTADIEAAVRATTLWWPSLYKVGWMDGERQKNS